MIPEDVYVAGLIPLSKVHGLPLWYAEMMLRESAAVRADFERSLRDVEALLAQGERYMVPLRMLGERLVEIDGDPFP